MAERVTLLRELRDGEHFTTMLTKRAGTVIERDQGPGGVKVQLGDDIKWLSPRIVVRVD